MGKHPYRDQIIAIVIVRDIYPVPMRLVASKYQKLYVSRSLKPDLDPDDLSRILVYMGNHFHDMYYMFRKFTVPGGLLFTTWDP